ncbi:MAG TPA: pyruvate ferredoxin oxidoreductase [Candidatus Methanofastidiosa archaeon]|nr:pyruvate ferredoxin oxidoreductase [Candidatus Methanofastidiosa archaeon]
MAKSMALTGNFAAAYATKQINPHVVAAYPITPQTTMMEKFSEYYANGEVDTELICVESEHSAMSACVGAAAAGGRVITSTAANGLALMFEIVYIAASNRLPIVMCVMNRALSAPINIHGDHSDSMGCRDSGWIQIYNENAQEVYDTMFMATRIGEHKDVRLPVMVNLDGFITSHKIEKVDTLEDDEVRKFIGEYQPVYPLLDIENPVTYGPLDLTDYYFEHKRQQVEAMKKALPVIKKVSSEYSNLCGRDYGIMEKYHLDDADCAIVTMSSTAGTTKYVVDKLRAEGKKVGLLKVRLFRPFPAEEIREALAGIKNIAVLDRSESFGAFGGPLFSEVRNAMYDTDERPNIVDYVFGLGGRDINAVQIEGVYKRLMDAKDKMPGDVNYLGVRGD